MEEPKMYYIPKTYLMPLYGDEGDHNLVSYVTLARPFTDAELEQIQARVDKYMDADEAWNYDGVKKIFEAYAVEVGIHVDVSFCIVLDPKGGYCMDP